jgi:uncharacterized tellurite resistance protein B-like protein
VEDLPVLHDLAPETRLTLMKFVCSFAWADLEITDAEREYVARLVRRLDLDSEERKRVDGWLELPPPPESVDPTRIPAEHRRVFVDAVQGVIAADGEIATEERENLALFSALLA